MKDCRSIGVLKQDEDVYSDVGESGNVNISRKTIKGGEFEDVKI